MGKDNHNAKWTRGRSTVARVTNGTKQKISTKEHALNIPIKFLNSIFTQKRK